MTIHHSVSRKYLQLFMELDNKTKISHKSYCSNKFFLLFGFDLFFHRILPHIGQTKVNKFKVHAIFVSKKEILRFEVSMCNMFVMTVIDGLKHLHKKNPRIILRKVAIFL